VRITRGLERSKEETRPMPGRERGRQKTCCEGIAAKGNGVDYSFEAERVPSQTEEQKY
jgi:hypothetical protein